MASLSESTAKAVRSAATGYAAAVLLAALYPTVFVLSQNWYALPPAQSIWLVAVAILSGLAVYALVEIGLRAAGWAVARWRGAPPSPAVRPIAFAVACTVVFALLISKTMKATLGSGTLAIIAYVAIGAVIVWAFSRGAQRYVNAFLALLTAIAGVSWAASAMDTSQSWIATIRQDFERTRFKRKPNIYLFIYDAYGSEDAFRKVFAYDNARHYGDLRQRQFKVVHTFANYGSTLQTAIAVFLGLHHYYGPATGFNDSKKGRSLLAGLYHNPVLETLRSNGYRLQYIHSLDYFVNEQGVLDYMFPEKPVSDALRVFGLPLLKIKRVLLDEQREVLYSRLRPAPAAGSEPWFTFAHVNLPGHANLNKSWRDLADFETRFRERTAAANTHMLETIDRIRAVDPDAVVVLFGDHGAHRYNRLATSEDLDADIQAAGATLETVTLDQFGIMIAVGSAGRCDDYVYDGMTPVNIMRTVFACLAEDRRLLAARADDISLHHGKGGTLLVVAEDGKALPAWKAYTPLATPFN
jgi:hypothetical protein